MTIASLKQHPPHPWFEVRDDCLMIGGRSILDVATEVGHTPFYAYDRSVMTRKVRELREVLPKEIRLHYAMKANPRPTVVAHMLSLVDGLDVASAGELRVAIEAGADPTTVSFAGPGKTDAELEQAAAADITVNIESERELRCLAAIGQRTGKRPRVAVRVNPDFELKTSGMKMGGGPKQFGIDAERVPEVLTEIGRLPVTFVGFHIFSGSQNLRPEAIVEAQQKTVALAIQLSRAAPGPVTLLNIGGGFGIPYFPGEQPLDLAPIAANLRVQVEEILRAMPKAEIVIELGRYLVGESGVYICKVIDRKISRNQTFLVTDGGLHHHLAASGNFGQVIRKNYPVVIANRVQGTDRETASVVGPLCTPLDLLADRMEMARADVGDLVAVLQSGAYGLTASPLRFLSHAEPGEILL
jgi:diaminopimelate decarboxylase